MHVPPGLWLSVFGGALVVAAVVAGRVWQAGSRGVATAIVGWLAADVGLAAAGAFATNHSTLVPVIAFGIAVPIAVGVWMLSRVSAVSDAAGRLSLPWIVGVQTYRVVGAVFLVAWALGLMPAVFALPAGIGDVAIGLAAPFVASRIGRDPSQARRAAVAWNVAGIADLVLAVTLGFLSSPSRFQQLALSQANTHITRMPFVLVPVFAVPLSVLLHVVALRRLTAGAAAKAVEPRAAVLAP